MTRLDFSNKTPRRIGLSRAHGTPIIAPPTPKTDDEMPSKTKKAAPPTASREASEEDIERPPDEADDTDNEAAQKKTTIQPTKFARREGKPVTVNGTRTLAQEEDKANGTSRANSLGIQPGKQQSSQSSRQSSQESSGLVKRKSSGERMFGGQQKKPKITFGKSSAPPRSSASTSTKINSSAKSKADKDGSPPPKWKQVDDIPDSEGSQKSDKESEDKHKFRDIPPLSPSPVKKKQTPKPQFKDPGGFDELGSSPAKSSTTKPRPTLNNTCKKRRPEPPLTQMPAFNPMDDELGDSDGSVDPLAGDGKALFSDEELEFPRFKKPESEPGDTPPGSQSPRCPFCKQEVDPTVLKKFEGMSTREQEKFCQTHQKEDAKREWVKLDYPRINWTNLDARINKHHKIVKKLINGMDSYYRADFQAKIDAGQDRNLRKATTNLTPGYYGGRGMRVLSENIMNEHSKLLKKRAPLDTLLSARGVTAFVQSVLVREVAVLLIKEDMRYSTDEARALLEDSARIGELVHEEIREVVKRRPEHDVDEFSD